MTRVVSNNNIALYWMMLYCSQSFEVVHVSLELIIVTAEKHGQMHCHLHYQDLKALQALGSLFYLIAESCFD